MTALAELLMQIQAREAKATAGPWTLEREDGLPTVFVLGKGNTVEICQCDDDPDAEFVCHARTDVPTLVRLVRVLMEMLSVRHSGLCYAGDENGCVCGAQRKFSDAIAAVLAEAGKDRAALSGEKA